MHYFDWTATTKISENALNEYVRVSEKYFGNPSSNHSIGQEAKQILDQSRCKIAEMLKTGSDNIFFTSGGTESNSIILNSLLAYVSPGEVLTTSIEHSAILEHKSSLESHNWKFTTINCPNGFIGTERLNKALNPSVRMVCIMYVNNVIGSVQPLEECIRIVRNYSKSINRNIHIHCDAVQALGKINVDLSKLDIDSAAFSSHKFFGPKGIGILYNRNKAVTSLSKGGGQEKGLRPGTENLPAIAAMTKALSDSITELDTNYTVVSEYRNQVMRACSSNGFHIISPINNCSPYILTVAPAGIPSEVFLRVMADKGFCLSAGSACSSNIKSKTESVLSSMNILPDIRRSAIRISFSKYNTQEEINLLIENLISTKEELK